jgi:hypothetical protein
MKIGDFTMQWQCLMALVLIGVCASRAGSQDNHSHSMTIQQSELNQDQQTREGVLIKIVRESTVQFQDVSEAEKAGYALQFGCVSGPDSGAMGLHYVNMDLVRSGILDARHPQIVIYEPTSGGRPRLTGADYLLLAAQWDKEHPSDPPQLMGQLFHLFESPNRFGLPAFYTLHVWAWKENPKGAFVNWHPNVSCEAFADQNP